MKKEPPKRKTGNDLIILIIMSMVIIVGILLILYVQKESFYEITNTNRLLSEFHRIDTVKDEKPEATITKNEALNTEDCYKQFINNGKGDSTTFYDQRFENCALFSEETEINGGIIEHHPNPMAFIVKHSEVPVGRGIMIFHHPVFKNSQFDHVIFITVKPDFQAETTNTPSVDDPNLCYHWSSDCKSNDGSWSECSTVCHMQPEPK